MRNKELVSQYQKALRKAQVALTRKEKEHPEWDCIALYKTIKSRRNRLKRLIHSQ